MVFLPSEWLHMSPLLAFGCLLVVGALGGYLAHLWSWLPSITGFMIVGFLIGPGGLGLLNEAALQHARILIDIALALILYRLGTSLDLRFIRQNLGLLLTSLAEAIVSFCGVFTLLWILQFPIVIAAVIAAILISSSPAVLLHVAHEVGAKGPVTESAKTLVALNNLWSFLAFVLVIPALLLKEQANLATVVFQPLYLLGGSALLGLVMGLLLHFLTSRTHKAEQYKIAFVVGTLMLTLGLAQQLKVSALFAPLLVGIVVRSIERETVVSAIEFGSAFELFFIALFVYAGANLHLADLWQFAGVIVALVVLRSMLKTSMVALALRWQGVRWPKAMASGLLLIPMAGLAIGLTQTSTQLVPEQAALISAIVLGAVTLFETLGPPIAAWAFRLAKETAEQQSTRHDANPQEFNHPTEQSPVVWSMADWQIPGSVAVDMNQLQPVTSTEQPQATISTRRWWQFWSRSTTNDPPQ